MENKDILELSFYYSKIDIDDYLDDLLEYFEERINCTPTITNNKEVFTIFVDCNEDNEDINNEKDIFEIINKVKYIVPNCSLKN